MVRRMHATPLIHARVGALHRIGHLTPYLAELIVDDVRRRGPGARVDVLVAADLDTADLDTVRALLSPLGTRGVRVLRRHAVRTGVAA